MAVITMLNEVKLKLLTIKEKIGKLSREIETSLHPPPKKKTMGIQEMTNTVSEMKIFSGCA